MAPLTLKIVAGPSRLDAARESRAELGISMKTGEAKRTFGDLFHVFTVGSPGFAETRIHSPVLGWLLQISQERFYLDKARELQVSGEPDIRFGYLCVTEARSGRQIA